jgi:hypothetical protein
MIRKESFPSEDHAEEENVNFEFELEMEARRRKNCGHLITTKRTGKDGKTFRQCTACGMVNPRRKRRR